MKTLISCVGDTDPIRNRHDGPLLHITRVYRPEKIILIHSERSLKKHEAVCQALESISGYHPDIIKDQIVIKDEEVFLFDRMFDLLRSVIQSYYQAEEEILLNLTSATPQIISAMFSINRISGLNVRAFQVATPMHTSNEGILHDNQQDIHTLIAENEDNRSNFVSRVIEDKGEKFNQTLTKKNVIDLIRQFDYEGAYQLSTRHRLLSKKKNAALNRRLQSINEAVKFQKMLPDIEQASYSEHEKVLLNGYLLIDLQAKRGLTSEVLIRIKNLAEFVSEFYLSNKYFELIVWEETRPYLNTTAYPKVVCYLKEEAEKIGKDYRKEQYLSLPMYINIIRCLEPDSPLLKSLNKINGANHLRNKVAHGFKEIDPKSLKIKDLVFASKCLLDETMRPDASWYEFFEKINEELSLLLMN